MTTTTSAAPKSSKAEDADLQAVENLKAAHATIKAEMAKVIVGQQQVIDEMLICDLHRGAMRCWWACRGWPRR